MEIKIRYNTDKDKVDSALSPWRVLIEGKEHLAEKVNIQTGAWTTYDEISPGKFKWHITCDGTPHWDVVGGECVIR